MELQIDNQTAVHALQDISSGTRGLHLLCKIKTYMEGIMEFKVVKVHRTTNCSADSLEKFSLSLQGGPIELSEYPSFLYNLLLDDISGFG